MSSRFTEQDTESFYDAEDALYRSFWDEEGSLHWGIFDESTGDDFLRACANLNRIMALRAALDPDSRVLDLGCGNGNTATWLCRTAGCRVTGVDLSGVRIGNANADRERLDDPVKARLSFKKASATALPFDDGSFTHVWSQAAIYHIHDKGSALSEAHRVLEDGGILVFDDLIKPRPDISTAAQTYVYDRLIFDTPFSFHSYQEALKNTGFLVQYAEDISQHLRKSYTHLGIEARQKSEQTGDKFHELSNAYDHMIQAVCDGELGWGLYLCRKNGGPPARAVS